MSLLPCTAEREGSHELSEAIRKYGDETKGDDVLVIMPGKELSYAVMPRQKFHETQSLQ